MAPRSRGSTISSHSAGYRAALAHRDFRWLVSALIVDQIGGWSYSVALAVFVFTSTHSAAWVGAVTVGRFVPALVFSPYAGVLVDRFERTRVMRSASSLSAVWMLALAVCAAVHAPAALAVCLAGLNSVTQTVYAPAVAAIVPQIVGERDLAAANALDSAIENAACLVGPGLGALLLLLPGGAVVAFAVNAGTDLYAAFAVSRLATRSRPTGAGEGEAGPLRQMLVGLRTITSSSTAAVLVAYSALATLIYGADTVLFAVISRDQLGTGATGYGYLLAGLGLGGLLGAGLVNRLAGLPRLGLVITLGMVAYCLPTAALVLVHAPAVAFALQVVRGAGTLVVDVLAVTALQRSLRPEVTGRVFGVFWALIMGALSIGGLITPPLLSLAGLHPVLLVFGLGVPAAVVCVYPWLRRLDRAALGRLAELAPRVAVLEVLGIFAAAPRPVLEALAESCTEVPVASGTTIVKEGDVADALYVLAAGEVAVSAKGEAGRGRRLRTMNAPSYFGEIGLLEHIPRTATVRAIEDCTLYRIEGDAFFDALNSAPAAPSLLEGAKTRLARTHPSYQPAGALVDPAAAAGA